MQRSGGMQGLWSFIMVALKSLWIFSLFFSLKKTVTVLIITYVKIQLVLVLRTSSVKSSQLCLLSWTMGHLELNRVGGYHSISLHISVWKPGYMDSVGVGVHFGCGCLIWKYFGETPNCTWYPTWVLESGTGAGCMTSQKNVGHCCSGK